MNITETCNRSRRKILIVGSEATSGGRRSDHETHCGGWATKVRLQTLTIFQGGGGGINAEDGVGKFGGESCVDSVSIRRNKATSNLLFLVVFFRPRRTIQMLVLEI